MTSKRIKATTTTVNKSKDTNNFLTCEHDYCDSKLNIYLSNPISTVVLSDGAQMEQLAWMQGGNGFQIILTL